MNYVTKKKINQVALAIIVITLIVMGTGAISAIGYAIWNQSVEADEVVHTVVQERFHLYQVNAKRDILSPSIYQDDLLDYHDPNELANNFDVTKPSLATSEQIDDYLKDTELNGLGTTFKQAEQDSGVNALFLMSICILESSWGSSDIAHQYNNIMGYGVLDDDNNLGYSYDDYSDCILSVASNINRDYLQKDAPYYNGTTIADVNIKYCVMENWSYKLCTILQDFNSKYTNIKNVES